MVAGALIAFHTVMSVPSYFDPLKPYSLGHATAPPLSVLLEFVRRFAVSSTPHPHRALLTGLDFPASCLTCFLVALQLLLQEYSSLLEIANEFEYETTELQERHHQAQKLLVPDRHTPARSS